MLRKKNTIVDNDENKLLNISQVNENKNIQKENTESTLQIKKDVIKKEECVNVKKESSPLDELTAAINKYVPTTKNNSEQKNILQYKNENEIVANENDAATNLKNLISKAKNETLIRQRKNSMLTRKFVKHVTNENEEPIFYQGLFYKIKFNKNSTLFRCNFLLIN